MAIGRGQSVWIWSLKVMLMQVHVCLTLVPAALALFTFSTLGHMPQSKEGGWLHQSDSLAVMLYTG